MEETLKEKEPEISDNSISENVETKQEGQSQKDPELILGKFKSVDDLSKAYTELQRSQGANSQELGDLRKEAKAVNDLSETLKQAVELQEQMSDYLTEYRTKYDKPEYFQDTNFREIYKEAFKALGKNLDTDRFISLLENYVAGRIVNHNKTISADEETQKVLNSMTYEENTKSSLIPPKKSFDEMTTDEIDKMLDRLV